MNTLRYADRIKERKVGGQARANAAHPGSNILNANSAANALSSNNRDRGSERDVSARENVMPPAAPTTNNNRANAAAALARYVWMPACLDSYIGTHHLPAYAAAFF